MPADLPAYAHAAATVGRLITRTATHPGDDLRPAIRELDPDTLIDALDVAVAMLAGIARESVAIAREEINRDAR